MVPSQEDEWKQMINQDPRLGSVTGDSGHSTMTVTGETESTKDVKKLTGAVGGVDRSASVDYLLDVKWRDDDPLFVFDDDNVMKPQPPTTALTPFKHVRKKIQLPLKSNHLLGKIPAFENLLLTDYQRQLQVISNLTMTKKNWWDSLGHLWWM